MRHEEERAESEAMWAAKMEALDVQQRFIDETYGDEAFFGFAVGMFMALEIDSYHEGEDATGQVRRMARFMVDLAEKMEMEVPERVRHEADLFSLDRARDLDWDGLFREHFDQDSD